MDRMAMLKEVLAANPNDAFARYGLALELANSGQSDAALAEFAELLQRNPEYVPGYQMYAQTLLRLGRVQQARDLLHKGIQRATRAGNAHAQSEMQGMLDEIGT